MRTLGYFEFHLWEYENPFHILYFTSCLWIGSGIDSLVNGMDLRGTSIYRE